MRGEKGNYYIALSVLIGTCIGGGVLGLPYVASQAGFFVTAIYILFVGGLIYMVNAFLGEVILRTKEEHQLIGYVEKYMGVKARHVMEFAVVFGIYSALIAFMLGMGQSLSYLFFKTTEYVIPFGIFVGLAMSFVLRGGMESLKKYEKYGVLVILSLLVTIVIIFLPKTVLSNIVGFEKAYLLLPFGVVLFAFKNFDAIPEVRLILKGQEKSFKKVLIAGILVSMAFYLLFTFVVLGYMGDKTPQVATLALGGIFILLGMFTMFTSYLSVGSALTESFQVDERYTKTKSWILATIIPICLFVLTQMTDFFSFTRILSIGGVVSGGLVAIMSLLMVNKAKKYGDRKPEYSVESHWYVLSFLILVFALGVIFELVK